MPIPERRLGENKKKFVRRCVKSKIMKEYPIKQRLAICYKNI